PSDALFLDFNEKRSPRRHGDARFPDFNEKRSPRRHGDARFLDFNKKRSPRRLSDAPFPVVSRITEWKTLRTTNLGCRH
ncbi:hypothetical protein, partial [Pullulanibacillus pueri]|uniref:hypothetical protein n=1 Tax=Pullulanibacillus pueri TaxID=1437324 RepID=UPI0016654D8A